MEGGPIPSVGPPDVLQPYLVVGIYTISNYPVGEQCDYWIENSSGEGMQVFKVNFEKCIDELFKSEF